MKFIKPVKLVPLTVKLVMDKKIIVFHVTN